MATYSPDMPAKLAESAFKLFSQSGINKVNMDMIAAEAGVTKGSLYWHYKSKDDIIKAACNHYYSSWHRRVNSELARIPDPIARLTHVISSSVKTCLLDKENRVFTMEIFTLSLYDEEIRRGWRQFFDSVRAVYIGLVEAASIVGEIEIDDPERVVDHVLTMFEGLKLRALFEPNLCCPEAERRLTQDLMEIITQRQPTAVSG